VALAKVKAREHLINFMELDGAPRWQRARHLELLCSKLEQLELAVRNQGGIKRLIVTMQPRGGKSEVISKKFPVWFLGRNPDEEVVLATFGAELAQDHSTIARDTFAEWAPQLWGLHLSDKSQAKAKWKVADHHGGMTAVGVGGALTGRGSSLLIIDDPVENAEDALSITMQDRLWNWYQAVAGTRLSPTGVVVILMTRWSQQDLVGKLLAFEKESEEPENWEVLNLPAICEEPNDPLGRAIGDVLWPERFPKELMLHKKANMESFWWECLYQQKPMDLTTQVFRPEDMQLVEPESIDLTTCRWYGACDPSEGGNDYAAIVIVGVLPDQRWLVWESDLSVDNQSDTINKLIKQYVKYSTGMQFRKFWIEQNSLGHAKSAEGRSLFELELIRQLQTQHVAMPYSFVWNSANKTDRIRSMQPYYTQGKIVFPTNYNKIHKILTEQLRFFPLYKHDDGPDALELCIRGIIEDMRAATVPTKFPRKVIRSGSGYSGPFI
jgi:predicted phage terminase large subunit-like protein